MKNLTFATLLTAAVLTLAVTSEEVQAQEQMIGEIRIFAGTFAPRGWVLCQGQVLSVSEYPHCLQS
ncbi:phage tail protein [Rubinisphaera sp.]|uniref:phage tail protein n=1 Tax=uncultured Rubinisphaera sp. TaxID=1678686 RepID=UPI0025D0EA6C|nr:phage tail protein [Rubinisphaera sp.]